MSNTQVQVIAMPDVFFNEFVNIVAEEDRMDFLPTLIGNVRDGLMYENASFVLAQQMSSNYKGGYWEFCTLKDGVGGFMMIDSKDSFEVSNPSTYFDAVVDSRVFSVMLAIMLFSHCSFQFYKSNPELAEKMANLYHQTRNAFYSTVDKLAYADEIEDAPPSIATPEEIEQIKAMSSAVYSLLD